MWIAWVGITSATAQSSSQLWSGTGQILSGQGQGATVQLVLEMGDGYIRTRSGPELNASYPGGSQAVNTSNGLWQIEPQGDRLSVTLHRGDQIIRYQLYPAVPSQPSTRLVPQSSFDSSPQRTEAQPQRLRGRVVPKIQELILGN